MFTHLFRARRPIIVAKQPEQGTVEFLRHVDRRDRCFLIELLFAHHHPAAPKLYAGINILFLARINESVAASGTRPEDAHPAIEVRLGTHPLYGSRRVPYHLSIGNSALGADLGGNVVGITLSRAFIEVCADSEIAMVGESARRLDIELAPARKMMNQHHAGKRTRTGWLSYVSGDWCSLVTVERNVLAGHASVV
jgi:hypothetical protein